MASSKNKSLRSNVSIDEKKRDIPVTLKGSNFYGLELDEKQIELRDAIWDPNIKVIMVDARAGTGKTTIAVGVANLLYQYGLYDWIDYIISPTQEEKQGYLPGDLEEKSANYMEPLYEALTTIGLNPRQVILSSDNIQGAKEGTAFIKCMPHTFLRGTNFSRSIVIMDECQNFFLDEMRKVLTRVHDDSKVICIGHTGQCDLYKHPERSGFATYLKYYNEAPSDRVRICNLYKNHRGWISTYADDIDMWLERKHSEGFPVL